MSTKLRIALVTDAWHPQINGVVRTLTEVTERLTEWGHEMYIIHPGQFATIPLPRYNDIKLSLLPGRLVRELLDDARPDAVHIATEGPLGIAARRWCARRDVPFTTSYHTQFAQYARAYYGLPESITYRVLRWFHNGAVRTLVPTATIARELETQGLTGLITWTRGVDRALFKPRSTSLYDDLARPIILYLGRVAREKNIDAFLDLDVEGTRVVVGDGPILSTLRKTHPDVVFLGVHRGPALAERVAGADVMVFPSLTDTFGVVMIEAMACGVPVAAFPVSGPIDVVRDGVTGALDEDLLAATRRALELDRKAVYDESLDFTWDRCAKMFLDNLEPIAR